MDKQPPTQLYPQRHYSRLNNYDYSSPSAYFVTICTLGKICLFGDIIDSTMKLNQSGLIVESSWKDIPLHYSNVNNDIFIVMPNHIHGIISINGIGRAGSKPAPTKQYSLSELVRAFKTYSSRRINKIRNSQGVPVWQRGYYERVIRNENDYRQVGDYILYNAAKWESESENPLQI